MFAVACSDNVGGEGDNGGEKRYTVTVIASEGIRITSENPLTVNEGERAVFTVAVDKNTVVQSVLGGSYDHKNRRLTVSSVGSDIRVTMSGERVDYDTSYSYDYELIGTSGDKSSHKAGSYQAGTRITVSAGLENRSFVGWTVGGYISDTRLPISTERELTLALSPDLVSSGKVTLYANYADGNVMYYDVNGGKMKAGTDNLDSPYYTLDLVDGRLKLSLSKDYYELTECASTFYDDGTFVRDGYVLTEYNTEPDGSGEGYSLGSKFPLNLNTATLYCIWSKDSDHSDFEYEEITLPRPDGVTEKTAPHWVERGIKITSYNGDDERVVIPEKIDGKTVTAIGAGAFKNKEMSELVMHRHILLVEDGAFVECGSLNKIYYPDGIFDITNDAFDSVSWSGVKSLFVNATIAPRFASTLEGAYALKLTRLMANAGKPRIIVIAGSSAVQGLAAGYLEALFEGEYCVINFGTTRTTQGYMYLEAMNHFATDSDTVLFAPENSIYMLGEPRLYWKTLRDMEGMYNLFRYVDISAYENVLGSFCEFNKGDPDAYDPLKSPRYYRAGGDYGDLVKASNTNEYGEYLLSAREKYCDELRYRWVYKITLNSRVKSIKEGSFLNSDITEDYYTAPTWCDMLDAKYKDNLNRAILSAKESGARVYFSYCPMDAAALSEEIKANGTEWFATYEKMIADNYVFDGAVGSVSGYVYHHKYFYDNAFHPNDYGRAYRTYTLYRDLCAVLGKSAVNGIFDVGTDFEGCLFEMDSLGYPVTDIDEYFVKE